MRYPIRGLGRLSAATLPKGCAGWNCHQLAPRVSDPADIHGGNAVAEGRHSEVHDELSVRTYPPLRPHGNHTFGRADTHLHWRYAAIRLSAIFRYAALASIP